MAKFSMHAADLMFFTTIIITINGVTSEQIEVFVNDSASVRCYANASTDIQWHFNSYTNYVYAGRRFFIPYRGRFRSEYDEAANAYNLIIPRVKLEDSGRYYCSEEDSGYQISFTQLTVLYVNPVCSSNMHSDGFVGPNTCNLPKQDMIFTCNVSFNGRPPYLMWKSSKDSQAICGSTCEIEQYRITCNLTFKYQDQLLYDGSFFVCDAVTPDGTRFSCNTEVIKVQYFLAIYTNEEKKVHESANCEVKSNLNVKYNWRIKQNNEDLFLSANSTILIQTPGYHQCEVEYSIRNTSCFALVSNVNVSELVKEKEQTEGEQLLLIILLMVSGFLIVLAVLICFKLKRSRKLVQKPDDEFKRLMSHTVPIGENEPFIYRVYIGFSPKDKKTFSALLEQLKKNNVRFYLRNTNSRNGLQSSIREGVGSSVKCLLFLSSDYLKDEWYNIETAAVFDKVKLFGPDSLIVIKSESLRNVPKELQEFKEKIITKKQLSNADAIVDLVADIKRELSMTVKYGPATAYFNGYLSLILPDYGSRVEAVAKEEAGWLPKTLKKILIIVPESCICPSSMTVDGKIEFAKYVVFKVDRAGNKGRHYNNSLYKVKEGNDEYYFAGEFATPLLTLYETYKTQFCIMSQQMLYEERDVFFYTLKAILNHPENAICKDQYKLVFWKDRDTESSDYLDLHQFLLKVLKEELNLEGLNESSENQEPSDHDSGIIAHEPAVEVIGSNRTSLKETIKNYPMNKSPRGTCLIIDNIEFNKDNVNLVDREGSEKDSNILKKLFQDLHFDVKIHRNVNFDNLEKVLITMNNVDHRKYDAFICCILSYGKDESIYTSDGKLVKILDIVEFFADKQCPSLRGKPKMFFIHATQSGASDFSGVQVSLDPDDANTHTVEEENRRSVPESASAAGGGTHSPTTANKSPLVLCFPDVLISCSAFPGSLPEAVSYRNADGVSYYIRALDKCLRNGEELKEALNQVKEKVKNELERSNVFEGRNLTERLLPFHQTFPMDRHIIFTSLKKPLLPISSVKFFK